MQALQEWDHTFVLPVRITEINDNPPPALWKGASRSPGRSTITAAPAFTLKPIMGGVEATLRYITHAAERYEVRAKLYQSAVEVLGHEKTEKARTGQLSC
ncbi:MAG: hypothetical protein ABI969_19100 [bacterium]